MQKHFGVLALSGLFVTLTSAHASPQLIAIGSLTGSSAGAYTDLSGLSGPLENGVAGNLLGGIGSGIAYAGGNTFLALPDRGPNATAYDSLVDDTVSYIPRFQTVTMALTQGGGGTLPYSLTPALSATTLLSSATPLVYGSGALGSDATHVLGSGVPALNAANGTYYFTGRSDGFDPTQSSGNPNNARLDPESIRVSNDGKSVFISDEYGPYVYQFDRATGQRIKSFLLPANLDVANLSAQGDIEKSGNSVGRVANKGMEGLAITPDGKTLVGIMQANLEQDKKKSLRIVTVDIATGATHEYAYQLTDGSGVSEIVAINDHEFLVDERDGNGLGDGTSAVVKKLYKIDLNGAVDVSDKSGNLSAYAVSKTQVLDMVSLLNANGIASTDIPSKIEGVAFGEDVTVDGAVMHSLWVANDNDFLAQDAGANNFYVFAVSDADLGTTYVAQQLAYVPEPASGALLLTALGMFGFIAQRRRR